MKKLFSLIIVVGMIFSFMGSSCSSKEITTAKMYIQQKKLDKAQEALSEEIAKNPNSDEGHKLLGDIYGEKGEFTKMVDSYNKSLGISPKFEKEIVLAKQRRWADNFNNGAAFYNRGTKINNKDSAQVFFNKSVAAFDEAIICQPDSAKSYEYKAYTYFNMGEIENAVDPLVKVTQLEPTPEIYARLGELVLQIGSDYMGKFYSGHDKQDSIKSMDLNKKAVKYLEEGKMKFPADGQILADLATAYVRSDMIETAMFAFKEGVEKEPMNKNYRYNYGVLLLGSKDYNNASEQFKKALEIDPSYENAIYNLGVTYIKWGAEMRDESIELGKEEETFYLEKYKLALPYLETYLKSNPDNPQIWDLLGKVYANLSMKKESEEAFKKADQNK